MGVLYTINTYALIHFATAIISLILVVLIWQRRKIQGGFALLLLFSMIFIWALCAGFEAAAISRDLKIFWAKIEYIGAYFSPPFLFLFSQFYTNRKFKLLPYRIVALFIIPITIIFLALTNERHGLIWSGFESGPIGTNSLIYEHGSFFWVGMGYIFTIVTISSLTLFLYSVKSQSLYKRQNRLVILASIIPITGSILYVTGMNPFPGLDIIPSSFLFTGVALLVGISKQKLLDVIPISHEHLIDQLDDGVLVVDPLFRVVDLNQSAIMLCKISKDDAIGKHGNEIIPFWNELVPNLGKKSPLKFEIELQGAKPEYLKINLSPIIDNRNQFMGWIMVIENITRRKEAERELQGVNVELEKQLHKIQSLQNKLREQAIRDPLTGAFNRGYLDETLQRELARAKRNDSPLCVMMIDVDHFKKINDTYGQKAGDYVLKTIGKLLMKDSRACDCVCRFGGDEFAVLLPEMSEDDAIKRAEHWRHLIKKKHVLFRNNAIAPTISIGITTYSRSKLKNKYLIENADKALYTAKSEGRDCVRVYKK